VDLQISAEETAVAEAVRAACSGSLGTGAAFGDGSTAAAGRSALVDWLGSFGFGEFRASASPAEARLVASVVRELGAAAAAVPVIPMALAIAAGREGVLYPVRRGGAPVILNHLDLGLPAAAVDQDGTLYDIVVEPGRTPAGKGRLIAPYSTRVQLRGAGDTIDAWYWYLGVCLSAFWTIGGLRSMADLTRRHAGARVQFGRPLSAFQGIQGYIAEIVIESTGLAELAGFTLDRLSRRQGTGEVDVLMCRGHQLSVWRETSRAAAQVHGAIGLCYEYPLLQHILAGQYEALTPITEFEALQWLAERYREVTLHHQLTSPAWPLHRADVVTPTAASFE
jgi:hypothetical protein